VRDDPAGRALPTVRDDPARAQPDHPRNVGLSPFEIESPTADREELDVRLAQARRRLAWAKEMAELGYLSPQGLQQAAREVENLEAQRRRAPGADRPEPTATETPTRAPESDGRDQEEATLLAARLQAERLQASRIERLFKDPLRLASSRDFELATEKVRETTARARGLLERYRGELRVLDARRKALQASREAAATLLAAAQEDAKEAATRAAQAVGTQAERRRAEAAVLERQADLLSREADLEENVIRGDQLRRGANVLVEALGPPPPAPSPGSPTVGEPVLPPRSR
jgi:hypothetical protein